jgi:hypothetical protein
MTTLNELVDALLTEQQVQALEAKVAQLFSDPKTREAAFELSTKLLTCTAYSYFGNVVVEMMKQGCTASPSLDAAVKEAKRRKTHHMTNKEFFIATLKEEAPLFKKAIDALPDDKHGHKVHDRSRAAGDLAGQLAIQWKAISGVVTSGTPAFDPHEMASQTKAEMLKNVKKDFHNYKKILNQFPIKNGKQEKRAGVRNGLIQSIICHGDFCWMQFITEHNSSPSSELWEQRFLQSMDLRQTM